MMKEAPPDIKRRRISAADSAHRNIRCLTDLPSGILSHAATFLAAPSRALFAVALDENSAALPNERNTAIVGNQWDILHFGQIEKELTAKLSDDDIKKVLLCIDAVNNVRRLKLANCVNITGDGLEPLRGSFIIEQIDLSLAGDHQNHYLSPDHYRSSSRPKIKKAYVLPILDSIIEREGCALMHLQFPFVWRKEPEPSTESEFQAFMLRYNQMCRNREEVVCLECNTRLPAGQNQWINFGISSFHYGNQNHTCYDCFRHYCYSCETVGGQIRMLAFCGICRRDYCTDCSKMHVCRCCGGRNCSDCYAHECHKCNEKICIDCVLGFEKCYQCEECDRVFCSECSAPGVEDFERTCGECHDICCDDCRFRRFQLGQHNCAECIKTIVPLLVDENKRLHLEVEQLKVEMKELK